MRKREPRQRRNRTPNARKDNVVKKLSRKLGISAMEVFRRAYEFAFQVLDLRKVKAAFDDYKDRRKIPDWVRSYSSSLKPA